LRFTLKVAHRYHFEAATVPQLEEIMKSGQMVMGDLAPPKADGQPVARPANRRARLQDFETIQRIGEGAQGAVALVRHKKTKRMFAMKSVKLERMKSEALEQVKREKDVLSHVRHPFLVQLFFSFVEENKIFLVLELANGGELFIHLQRQKGKRFPHHVATFYIAEVASAIGYLHAQDIIYRDLKPENLLIADDGHIKITDFGLARESITGMAGAIDGEPAKSIVGTPEYFAPEILLMVPYGKAVDWWTVGVLTFELMTGVSPFHQEKVPQPQMFAKIKSGGAGDRIFEGRAARRLQYPPDAQDFILQLLNPNPETRLGTQGGFNDVKDHPCFTRFAPECLPGFTWDKLEAKEVNPPWKPASMNIRQNVDSSNARAGTFMETKPLSNSSQHDPKVLSGFEFTAEGKPFD